MSRVAADASRHGRRRGPERTNGVREDGIAMVKAGGRWRTISAHLAAVVAGEVPPMTAEAARRDVQALFAARDTQQAPVALVRRIR